ncbi:hypothetical protein [Bradyrhizobium centrosematis]
MANATSGGIVGKGPGDAANGSFMAHIWTDCAPLYLSGNNEDQKHAG